MAGLPSIRAAAGLLGGRQSGMSVSCPGPGHGPHDLSLSVRFEPGAPDGFLVYSHAGDDPIACRDHVRAALNLPAFEGRKAAEPVVVARAPRPKPDNERERIQAAADIWRASRDPRGTLAEVYLASRGLELGADVACSVLRFHPAHRHSGSGTSWPTLVALFRDLVDDKPCGIHRIYLALDGSGKAPVDKPKMMLGRAARAAVKLDLNENVELGLCVTEGIETGMAAQAMGFRPCWALGSAGAIGALPVLGGIEALTIVGETDEHGTNATESQKCADRWTEADVDVEVIRPHAGGDANDVLRRRA